MDIYRQKILEHYKNPQNFGHLKDPDFSSEEGNPLCGDKIGIDLKVKENKIQEISFWGEGCAISQAAASMLTEKIKGKSIEEVKKMTADDIISLLGIELSPARVKCALLSLSVLQRLSEKNPGL